MRSPKAILPLVVIAVLLSTFAAARQAQTTIAGIVVEEGTGAPLENATITVNGGAVAKTNAKGEFSLNMSRAGRYLVAPALRGYVFMPPRLLKAGREAGAWVQIGDGQSIAGVQLRMTRAGSIVGKVQTASGAPVPGTAGSATLLRYVYGIEGRRSLENVPGLHFEFEGSFVRMNDRGEFRFYELPPGEYYLRIAGGPVATSLLFFPGVKDERSAVPIRVTAGAEVRLPTIVLPDVKAVEVRLHYPNPAPFTGIQMMMVEASNLSIVALRREGKDEDEVRLTLAPGHYDFSVATAQSARQTNRPSPDALFGRVSVDVGTVPLDVPVPMFPGFRIGGKFTLENDLGERSPVTFNQTGNGSFRCRFAGNAEPFYVWPSGCVGMQLPAGVYRLHLDNIPDNQYVHSATANGHDVLAEGLRIDVNTDIEIVLRSDGAILEGAVHDSDGKPYADAVVAIVPDAPFRLAGGVLYRSTISDVNGKFILRGIAPGNYHVYAWSDLPGEAYRNAEFLKPYEDKGRPVHIERASRNSADVTVLD
jgi:hypothetical protein